MKTKFVCAFPMVEVHGLIIDMLLENSVCGCTDFEYS